MDLDLALTVLRRRAWLVLGLPVLVALVSLATYKPPPQVFQARLTFAVDVPRSALLAGSNEGDAANTGEALIDDISRIMSGDRFKAAVARRLPGGLDDALLASELSANDRHRVSDVTVTRTAPPGASPTDLARLQADLTSAAQAVVAELDENARSWFARLGEDEVAVTIVNGPTVAPLPPSLRDRLAVPLRVALGLLVAVGLAFLLHALDPRLYDAADVVDAAGAPVLGRIPGRSGRRANGIRLART